MQKTIVHDYSIAGVCNLFHWGATFENFNNVEGQSPSNMYKIIKCKPQPVYCVKNYYIASHTVNVGFINGILGTV